MRKVICLPFLLLMLCVAGIALAQEPAVQVCGEWQYVLLADGTAEIAGYTGTAADVAIPAELDGHAVTAIGAAAFYQKDGMQAVTVPEGVNSDRF